MACEHRGRGVGPSWACGALGALSKLLRVYLTPSPQRPLSTPPLMYLSGGGKLFWLGNHE
eukprot:7238686-Prymnesium_polylepis.1